MLSEPGWAGTEQKGGAQIGERQAGMLGCFLFRVGFWLEHGSPGLTLRFQLQLSNSGKPKEELRPFSLYLQVKGKVPRTLLLSPEIPYS